MPRWYYCSEPGCRFQSWQYECHECPELYPWELYQKWLSQLGASGKQPEPTPQSLPDVNGSDFVYQESDSDTLLTNVPLGKKVTIFPAATRFRNVVIMTWRFDKAGRLIILFPFNEKGITCAQKYLSDSLKAIQDRSRDLQKDKNGFMAVIDRISKKKDLRLVVEILNRELKGSLKVILVTRRLNILPTNVSISIKDNRLNADSNTLDTSKDAKTGTIDEDQSNASDTVDNKDVSADVTTMSDDADVPERALPCIPIYLPSWKLSEYIDKDHLDWMLIEWNKK